MKQVLILLAWLQNDPLALVDDTDAPPVAATAHSAPVARLMEATGLSSPAGASGVMVQPGLELHALYAAQFTRKPDRTTAVFHQFDLPRVHASLTACAGPACGRLVLEGVRSAGQGALLGVGGDSVLVRVREGFASWSQGPLDVRAGVVPTLTVPVLERAWGLRVVGATPLEVTTLAAPADMGATVTLKAPAHWGHVAVGMFNGEGYWQREFNRGKNVEVAAVVHPVPWTVLRPLTVLASFTQGSVGVGVSRADRATVGLLWNAARVGVGTSFTYGWGLQDAGNQRTALMDAYLRMEPARDLLLGARINLWLRDLRGPLSRATAVFRGDGGPLAPQELLEQPALSDRMASLLLSAGWRVTPVLETHAVLAVDAPGHRLAQATSGADRWELRWVNRVLF